MFPHEFRLCIVFAHFVAAIQIDFSKAVINYPIIYYSLKKLVHSVRYSKKLALEMLDLSSISPIN